MHSIQRVALVAIATLSCQGEQPRRNTAKAPAQRAAAGAADCVGPIFDGRGIGAIRIGMAADSISQSCTVVSDTTEVREEGLSVRVVSIVAGGDTVEAEVDSSRVWRISLRQTRFRTLDSLGVGVSVTRLLSLPGVHGMMGEDALYIVSPSRCGLSFQVTNPRQNTPRSDWPVEALRRLPPSSVVTEVLIIGCQPAI